MVRVIWERPSPVPKEIHRLAGRVSVRGRVVKEVSRTADLAAPGGVLVRVPSAGLATFHGRATPSDASVVVVIRRELEALSIGVVDARS